MPGKKKKNKKKKKKNDFPKYVERRVLQYENKPIQIY